MLAAPDHDTNNEADFQDSYTNLIIGAQTNHHINHSPAVKYYNANRLTYCRYTTHNVSNWSNLVE